MVVTISSADPGLWFLVNEKLGPKRPDSHRARPSCAGARISSPVRNHTAKQTGHVCLSTYFLPRREIDLGNSITIGRLLGEYRIGAGGVGLSWEYYYEDMATWRAPLLLHRRSVSQTKHPSFSVQDTAHSNAPSPLFFSGNPFLTPYL